MLDDSPPLHTGQQLARRDAVEEQILADLELAHHAQVPSQVAPILVTPFRDTQLAQFAQHKTKAVARRHLDHPLASAIGQGRIDKALIGLPLAMAPPQGRCQTEREHQQQTAANCLARLHRLILDLIGLATGGWVRVQLKCRFLFCQLLAQTAGRLRVGQRAGVQTMDRKDTANAVADR